MLDHLRNAPRNGGGQARRGAFCIHGLFRWLPIGRRFCLIHLQDWPKLHAASMAGTVRIMLQFRIGRDTITRRRFRENRIYQRKHGFGGPEGNIQRHRVEILLGAVNHAFVIVLFAHKARRIRSLEGIDGLLLITHREDAALFFPCTQPREEFPGQRPHNTPLFRVGILRLIQQDMIQPVIQLEQNPGAAWIIEQFARARDQIIVIQQAGIFLGRLVAAQHGLTNREKRHAGGEHARGGAFAIQHQQAFSFAPHQVADFILPRAQFLGGQFGSNFVIRVDENGAPIGMFCNALILGQREPCCQLLAMADILLATGEQKRHRRAQRLCFWRVNHGCNNRDLIFFARLDAKLPRQRGAHPRHALALLHGVQQLCAAPSHGADHFGKLCRRLVFRQNCQGRAIRPARQQCIAFARQKRPSILFLHHRELRRQARFQRKGAQQGLRETMQG